LIKCPAIARSCPRCSAVTEKQEKGSAAVWWKAGSLPQLSHGCLAGGGTVTAGPCLRLWSVLAAVGLCHPVTGEASACWEGVSTLSKLCHFSCSALECTCVPALHRVEIPQDWWAHTGAVERFPCAAQTLAQVSALRWSGGCRMLEFLSSEPHGVGRRRRNKTPKLCFRRAVVRCLWQGVWRGLGFQLIAELSRTWTDPAASAPEGWAGRVWLERRRSLITVVRRGGRRSRCLVGCEECVGTVSWNLRRVGAAVVPSLRSRLCPRVARFHGRAGAGGLGGSPSGGAGPAPSQRDPCSIVSSSASVTEPSTHTQSKACHRMVASGLWIVRISTAINNSAALQQSLGYGVLEVLGHGRLIRVGGGCFWNGGSCS